MSPADLPGDGARDDPHDPHRGSRELRAGVALDRARWAMIALHGRGGDAEDALAFGGAVAPPGTAIIAPEAAKHSWYPLRFLAPMADNQPWIDSALARIDAIVSELRGLGIPRERTLLVGFSQGACLGSEFIARHPDAIGAAALFTGGLIGEQVDRARYRGPVPGTPILLSTGDPDPHVPVARVRETAGILTALGAAVRLLVLSGKPHTVLREEADEARSMFESLT